MSVEQAVRGSAVLQEYGFGLGQLVTGGIDPSHRYCGLDKDYERLTQPDRAFVFIAMINLMMERLV